MILYEIYLIDNLLSCLMLKFFINPLFRKYIFRFLYILKTIAIINSRI